MAQGWLLFAATGLTPLLLACPTEELPPHVRLSVGTGELPLEGDRIHVVVRIDRAALGALRSGTIEAGSATASAIAVLPDSPDHVGRSVARGPDATSVSAQAEWLAVIGEDCDAVACEYGATIIVADDSDVPVVGVAVRAETPPGVSVSSDTRLELLADGGEPLLAVIEEVRFP
jgi:hypothetical protein